MSLSRPQLLQAAAAAIELKRRKAQRAQLGSLEAFVKAFWEVVETKRKLVWGWHMTLICQELERSYRGELPGALVINIPPRHSKSSLVSVLGPAWWWLQHPETQFLAITKADKNAKRDARLMRRVGGSEPYQQLLRRQVGDGQLAEVWSWSPDQNELKYFATTAGGHRISITTGTTIIGAGADILILDDIHDSEEVSGATPARALAVLEEAERCYNEDWCSRLNPGGTAQLIGQRLHARDLAGILLAKPDTTALVLPLEYEAEHPQCHPQDPRQEGEVLARDRFSDKDLARLKATPQMYAGQAQQRPAPKSGGQIKREWFKKRYTEDPAVLASQADEVWITVDAAKKASAHADFHSAQVWARIKARRILLARRHARLTYPQFESLLDGLIGTWKPTGVLIEDTANGTTYLQCRANAFKGTILVPFLPNETPGSDKSKGARAIYLERAAEGDQLELPDPRVAPWVEEWLYEITTFPFSAHDDDVDAASQLMLRWTLQANRPKAITSGFKTLNE
mgnify:CR=1 FL=1